MEPACSAPRIPEAWPSLGTRRERLWHSSGIFHGWWLWVVSWLLFIFLIGMVG